MTQTSTGGRREHEDPKGEYTSIAASATIVLPQTLGPEKKAICKLWEH